MCLKNFNLSYTVDVKVIQATFDCEWRSLINPQNTHKLKKQQNRQKSRVRANQLTHNWYLANRTKYGNLGYLKQKGLLFSCILCFISMLLWFIFWPTLSIGGLISYTYDALCLFGINIATIICYYNTPKFIDNFYIRNEMSFVTFALFFGIFLFILSAIIITFFINDDSDDIGMWSNIVYTHSNSITILIAMWLQTQYVISKCKDIINSQLLSRLSREYNLNINNYASSSFPNRVTLQLQLERARSNTGSRDHDSGHGADIHNPAAIAIDSPATPTSINSGNSGNSGNFGDTTSDKLQRITTASNVINTLTVKNGGININTNNHNHNHNNHRPLTPTSKSKSGSSQEKTKKKFKKNLNSSKQAKLSLVQCLKYDDTLELFVCCFFLFFRPVSKRIVTFFVHCFFCVFLASFEGNKIE